MIRFTVVEALLPIRNEVLREGKFTPDQCRFPSDKVDGAFHLGYYVNDELACAVSLHPQNYGQYAGAGYQLRGMATYAKFRGQGIGNQLVTFAIGYLREKQAAYIWCNARITALKFYQRLGFVIISDEFEIKGTGPHRVLYLEIPGK